MHEPIQDDYEKTPTRFDFIGDFSRHSGLFAGWGGSLPFAASSSAACR